MISFEYSGMVDRTVPTDELEGQKLQVMDTQTDGYEWISVEGENLDSSMIYDVICNLRKTFAAMKRVSLLPDPLVDLGVAGRTGALILAERYIGGMIECKFDFVDYDEDEFHLMRKDIRCPSGVVEVPKYGNILPVCHPDNSLSFVVFIDSKGNRLKPEDRTIINISSDLRTIKISQGGSKNNDKIDYTIEYKGRETLVNRDPNPKGRKHPLTKYIVVITIEDTRNQSYLVKYYLKPEEKLDHNLATITLFQTPS